MINENSTYFEISESGNSIRIELVDYNYANAVSDWDKNWVHGIVNVKAGAFNGEFKADFMTLDFEVFKTELEKLYENLNGIATFHTLEEQVVVKVTGDGIGHLKADCVVMDYAGMGNRLAFEIDFDQTHVPEILNQLNGIVTKFPRVGKLN